MAEIASAFVTIAPSARGFGSSLNKQVAGPIRSSGTSLGKTFGKLFAASAGLLAAAGLGHLLSDSTGEAREAQKVGAQTNAVLKSTGGVANVSAGQIGKLATALSNKIGVDDEAIQAGENMLLTFTRVRNEAGKGNDIFTQATRTVQDMAAAFGGDAVSNSKILGKALNDPVKGVSALTRVGVTFTDEQKKQIKALVDSGNVMGAQKIILGELAKETKGSAAAQATAGDKARVALGNLKETIGTALLPVIDKLATVFTDKIAPAIQTFIGQLQSGEGAGGRVAAIFGTLANVLGTLFNWINQNRTVSAVFIGSIVAMTVATAAFNAVVSANPISLVIIAIAALAAGLVYAYKHSETFRNAVNALWKGVKAAFSGIQKAVAVAISFIAAHWRTIIVILGGPMGLAVALITKHWDKIKAAGAAVIGWIKEHWPLIKAVLTGPFELAKTVIGKVWTALRQGASRVKTVVVGVFDAIKGAIQGAIDKIQSAIDWLGKLVDKAKNFHLPHIPGLGRTSAGGLVGQITGGSKDDIAAAYGILTRATDTAAKKADEHGKKLKQKIAKIKDELANARSDFASLAEPISSNFTQGLFDFTDASSFTANLTTVKGTLSTLLANFKKLLGEGLNPGFLYQLFQSGGPGLINSLAALDKASAQQAGGLFADVMSLSDQLGTAVAGATDKGAALENQTQRLERKLDQLIHTTKKVGDDVGRQVNGAAAHGRRRAA